MKPSLVAFASGVRLAAVDGAGTPSLAGRITALADLIPFVGTGSAFRGYHAFDVVVSSGNPLLATLALRAAAAAGQRAAVALASGSDPWPYDLATADETAQILASALGLDIPVVEGGYSMEWLLSRLLSAIPRDVPVIGHMLSPGDRHPPGEATLFMGEVAAPSPPDDPFHLRMMTVFDRFMAGRRLVGKSARGRTAVFAKQMILTSRPVNFRSCEIRDGSISWGDAVVPHGTARWDRPTYPDAAREMLEDLLVLSRGFKSAPDLHRAGTFFRDQGRPSGSKGHRRPGFGHGREPTADRSP